MHDAPAVQTEISVAAKVELLRRPGAYPDRPHAVDVVETHMSWVFLGDTHVYKFKKPVCYPFLDFTTLELRRRNCEREIALNRRLAGDVYVGIVPLVLNGKGALVLGGEGAPVEWLVKMKRLPGSRMLDAAIGSGTVRAADIDKVARHLIDFYYCAERVPTSGFAYRAAFADGIEANRSALAEARYKLPTARIERLTATQRRFLALHAALLQQRASDGRIVDAHGDLRPEHICLTAEPKIIDCLEFRREFRLLDPVDELAFLEMECERLGAPWVGERIFKRYSESAADMPPESLVRFYKLFRACLRAKLAAWHIADHQIRGTEKWECRADEYLRLAEHYADG